MCTQLRSGRALRFPSVRRALYLAGVVAGVLAVRAVVPNVRGLLGLVLGAVALGAGAGLGLALAEVVYSAVSSFFDAAAKDRLRDRLARRTTRAVREGQVSPEQAEQLSRASATWVESLERDEVKRLERAYYRTLWSRLGETLGRFVRR
jgi:hypothetical protein